MSENVPTVTPASTIDECMNLMSDKNIRYLPVMEGGNVTGIVSISDVVKEMISSQQETISSLKDYLYANS